jgi:quinolinate synthase
MLDGGAVARFLHSDHDGAPCHGKIATSGAVSDVAPSNGSVSARRSQVTAAPELDLPEGVQPTPLALLLLGRRSDPYSERGVECPGDLPAASDPDLVERARAAKAALGEQLFVLGHHYQRDEVIAFADVTGDSFKLAQQAAARPQSPYIVFCGVHFMAESADILTADHQQVILPDLAAGCSMADMAAYEQVEDAWDVLDDAGVADRTVPVSYMNSSAAIKAFTGQHGGTICTSSNAQRALEWAFERGEKALFLPDQHLGRNTAVLKLGLGLDDCVVFNPHKPGGGVTPQQLRDARMILWRGHCSVHGRFSEQNVDDVRARIPGVNVLVHPECRHEVVLKADDVGSTEYIIQRLAAAEPGSAWAVGTELNLVKRLAQQHPDKQVVFLDRTVCYCSTMNRIDLPHLVWALESLVAGRVVNRIAVDAQTAQYARVALERMLALPGVPSPRGS